MAEDRSEGRRRRRGEPPIPCEPVDLLAGIAPGVELAADELPPCTGDDDGEDAAPAVTTVAEVGKLVRSGDTTVRRLIRSAMLRPGSREPDAPEPERAGVPERSRERPGE